MTSRQFHVKSIAIIGAGPSGIAAAKYLLGEKAFQNVDVFEQRARVGGIWDYHEHLDAPLESLTTPQPSPHVGLSKPMRQKSGTTQVLGEGTAKEAHETQFYSPLYDRLETNIPRFLMGFSDLDWPRDSQLFPKHQTVTEYIRAYAEDVKHLIRFETQVTSVTPLKNGDMPEQWLVKIQNLGSGATSTVIENVYDAIVVASGHFTVPFIPEIKGMKEWSEKYPSVISHSMYYKKPEDYRDQKVVVVGNGPSGLDIAMQIMTICKKPLLQSQRSESRLLSDSTPSRQEKTGIAEFVIEDRAVRFEDGSMEKDVDVVLFATGYFYSFPFLQSLEPALISDGTHVQNLYQHLLYRQHPTIAFPVIQQRVIPFPMAEVQSAVLARLWSGRLTLPSEEEMMEWEEETYKETGGGRNFHLLNFPKDADYLNHMHDWAMSSPDAEKKGKKPPYWGPKEYWMRERFPAIKKAFQDRGDSRHRVTTLEELGFDFEEYKNEKQLESKSLL